MRIADAHVHFFSHGFFAALAGQKGMQEVEALAPLLDGWELPSGAADGDRALAARWVAELDSQGVARAALIASIPGDEESVATAVSLHPDRFFGYFIIDPLAEGAIERMERAAENPHLHVPCFFPAMHRYLMNDEAHVIPLMKIAAAHAMPVFVHCGALSVGVRHKLGLPSLFDMRVSNPIDLHPLALRFPQVPFLIPHFGAGLLREALMLADLCANVYLDTSSSNKWMRYEDLNLRSVFGRCLEVAGPARLLFGTDSSFFPRGWQRDILDRQATALYELGLEQAETQAILGGNLERLMAPRLARFTAPEVPARV